MADRDELDSLAKQLREFSTEPKLGSALETAGRLLTDAVAGGAFSGTEYLRLRRLLDTALYKGARSPYPHIFFAVVRWFIENIDILPAESRPDFLEGHFKKGETFTPGYLSKNLPAVAQLIEREAARLREEVTPEQSTREAGSAVQEAETPEAARVYGITSEGKLVLVPQAGDPNAPDAVTIGDRSSFIESSFQELHRAITARKLAQEEAKMEAELIASLAESWPERPWGDAPGVATPRMEWISAIQRWLLEFDPRRPDWRAVRSVLILAPFEVRPADLTEYQVGDVATLLANRPAAPTGDGVAERDGREQPDAGQGVEASVPTESGGEPPAVEPDATPKHKPAPRCDKEGAIVPPPAPRAWERLELHCSASGGDDLAKLDGVEYRLTSGYDAQLLDALKALEGETIKGTTLASTIGARPDRIYGHLPQTLRLTIEKPGRGRSGWRML